MIALASDYGIFFSQAADVNYYPTQANADADTYAKKYKILLPVAEEPIRGAKLYK
jgi:hypothetical protein